MKIIEQRCHLAVALSYPIYKNKNIIDLCILFESRKRCMFTIELAAKEDVVNHFRHEMDPFFFNSIIFMIM